MSVAELGHAATGPWGRSAMTALVIFIALWFDPRITYMQRDIVDNRAYTLAVDTNGTRKGQQDIARLQDTDSQFERRLSMQEARDKHVDETLSAILQKLSEKPR